MKTLILINDPPYGTERLYNGLRMAHALLKKDCELTVFLIGDAVSGAKAGQKTPDGFYNAERMVKRVALKGRVLLCGTCMDAWAISFVLAGGMGFSFHETIIPVGAYLPDES